MRRQGLLIAVLVLLVLGPYQNCSLHESEGRKQLESFLNRQSVDDSCSPFLFTNQLANYFSPANGPTDLATHRVGSQCVITAQIPVDAVAIPDGPEIYSCGLEDDPRVASVTPTDVSAVASGGTVLGGKVFTLSQGSGGSYLVESIATTMSSANSLTQFGFAVQKPDQSVDYFFVSKRLPVRFLCVAGAISTQVNFSGNTTTQNEITVRAGGISTVLDAGQRSLTP